MKTELKLLKDDYVDKYKYKYLLVDIPIRLKSIRNLEDFYYERFHLSSMTRSFERIKDMFTLDDWTCLIERINENGSCIIKYKGFDQRDDTFTCVLCDDSNFFFDYQKDADLLNRLFSVHKIRLKFGLEDLRDEYPIELVFDVAMNTGSLEKALSLLDEVYTAYYGIGLKHPKPKND